MDKFCWNENEVVITKTQCDLCEFQTKECIDKCLKYEKKPQEVIDNKIKCPCFSRKGKIKL